MSSPGIPQAPLAPPPPPPPPVPGQVPALRISTASEFGPRKTAFNGPQDPYEPPAAIQNAMMTKDKKPFTYTPGMGGKLDLSQIRSPRMARRVAKNANDEGIEGPPKSALAQEPRSPGSQPQTPSIYSHPQVAIPVFPQQMPQPAAAGLRNSTLTARSPPVIERQPEPAARPLVKVETRLQPAANAPEGQPSSASPPTSPTSPTQVTLTKAPTPWMQRPAKQPEELPEWARRTGANRSQDSSSGSESPQYQPQFQPQSQPASPQPPQPARQIVVVNAPRPQPQQRPSPRPQDVPFRIEDRPSVFAALSEAGHHQLSNTSPHHQSRWGNPVGQSAYSPGGQQGGARLIPIQVDGQSFQAANSLGSPSAANHSQAQFRPPADSQSRNMPRGQVSNQQAEPGPVQSNSFRVLQKITGTDADQLDEEQVRKLNLTEDDRFLMNKFKEQVDGDTYLHKEEDPRYRGAAIPSRAFRYLQNMTDSGDGPNANTTAPRPVNPATKKQNRNSNNFEETPVPTVYIPASEQQVPEPKKYMGGAIPSRSFRILQAMTAPESIGSRASSSNLTTTTPTIHITTATIEPVQPVEEARQYPSSSGSSLSSKADSESEKERSRDSSTKRNGDDEENEDSDEESDSSLDSKSYVAYSTGMSSQKQGVEGEDETEEEESSDQTNDEQNDEQNEEKNEEKNEEESSGDEAEDESARGESDLEDSNTCTVSVNLPLRRQSSVLDANEDAQAGEPEDEHVETFVAFTLKRPNSHDESVQETIQVQPTFIVTSTDDDKAEEVAPDAQSADKESVRDKRQTLLTVQRNSKEEVTDDEDSGVTSDVSRIISEADTDSECCQTNLTNGNAEGASPPTPPVVAKRAAKEYNRTQTHSRLFKLLTDEQMRKPKVSGRLSSHSEEGSSPSSGLTSPDCNPRDEPVDSRYLSPRHQLPARPKSLDCEALLRSEQGSGQDSGQDSYFQTWKSRAGPGRSPASAAPSWSRPRLHVYCPRVRSTKNVPQTLTRMRSPTPFGSSSTIFSSGNSNNNYTSVPAPVPVRTAWRC